MRELSVHFLIAIFILFILIGCSSFSSLDDKELVKIAKSYYSFYYSDHSIEMAVVKRGKFNKECDCYPVQFIISRPRQGSTKRTLYFFKNDSGTFEVREFERGIKFVSKAIQ